MSMPRTRLLALISTLAIAGCEKAPSRTAAPTKPVRSVLWVETVREQTLAREPIPLLDRDEEPADVIVDEDDPQQRVQGFGGAFNEAGWRAMGILSPTHRESVMRALFSRDGAALRLGRVPIGASDYAVSRYTHAETPGDHAMKSFSVSRDAVWLLPFVRAALRHAPDLRLWASAWTPPTWMKSDHRFDGGRMLDERRIYQAYALYLARFVEAWQGAGVPIREVAVQNEPSMATAYPSCQWAPDQYLRFVRDHLAPTFAKRGLDTGVMLGTFSLGDEFATYIAPVLTDPIASRVITSVGFQWGGIGAVPETASRFPGVELVQTETECGNWYWYGDWHAEIPGFAFDPERPHNDFGYANYTFNRIRDYFRAGVHSYYLWNLVLDERGHNLDREQPWPQNAAVVVNQSDGSVTLTPMYHLCRHFSRYIEPGAVYLPVRRAHEHAVAFRNPDGVVVLVTRNDSLHARRAKMDVGGRRFRVELAPRAFQTFLMPAR